jgi:hypothetical protein
VEELHFSAIECDVRQIEVHTAEPLVSDPSCLEVEIAIAKLKKCKSPGSDQILAELIQTGGEMLLSAIHKLINSVWNKEELPDQWKESVIVPFAKRVIKLTVIIIMGYYCYQLHLLIRFSAFFRYWRKKM